ncbi:MAG: SseB family protein [Lachnospiraceae bacterium]
MNKQELIKKIPSAESIYVIYSQITKMPYVSCHEETFDDFIYIYFDSEKAKAHAMKLNEEKIPTAVIKCEEAKVLLFLADLRFMGINAMCFVDEEEVMIQHKELLTFPEETEETIKKKPVDNPSLHLSILYLMQEVRRPIEKEKKVNVAHLEEETSANIYKGKFLLPVQAQTGETPTEGQEVKTSVMLLKNDKDEMFVPLLTDFPELRKFLKDKNSQVVVANFEGVMKVIKGSTTAGVVINPASSNVVLNKLGMLSIEKRFKE